MSNDNESVGNKATQEASMREIMNNDTEQIGKCRQCGRDWDGVSEHYCPVSFEQNTVKMEEIAHKINRSFLATIRDRERQIIRQSAEINRLTNRVADFSVEVHQKSAEIEALKAEITTTTKERDAYFDEMRELRIQLSRIKDGVKGVLTVFSQDIDNLMENK